jgi:hypothetical protein
MSNRKHCLHNKRRLHFSGDNLHECSAPFVARGIEKVYRLEK